MRDSLEQVRAFTYTYVPTTHETYEVGSNLALLKEISSLAPDFYSFF